MWPAITYEDEAYVARIGGDVVWRVVLAEPVDTNPFREVLIWPAREASGAGPFREDHVHTPDPVVAIGASNVVHLLAARSGTVVATVPLGDDRFGSFGADPDDVLYILGWQHVVAIGRDFTVQWMAEHVAVDGITWVGIEGDRIKLSAEMDPPGGWIDVELDRATGLKL